MCIRLFGEGSFIGKGILRDVDAFERALEGRFGEPYPQSRSSRRMPRAAGLLSDVQLYEEYPSRYSADAARVHRWIRGDWQICAGLLPVVPGLDSQYRTNPLSGLSQWKILDNLRRSLVPPGLTMLLALSWIVLKPAWL